MVINYQQTTLAKTERDRQTE